MVKSREEERHGMWETVATTADVDELPVSDEDTAEIDDHEPG